ncbi:MAG: ADOP family duplicated permease [Bryobacteraceae bacterium]|nr:ADOP family duplicated permease [Bryobacteraceae bacterium]
MAASGSAMFSGLWDDIRFGIRQLAKHPVFTVVALLLLALGIGANTAIFSLVDSVLLRPLPYPEPERLFFVRVRDLTGRQPPSDPNMAEYLRLEKGISSAEAVGTLLGQPFNLRWNGRTALVFGGFASPDYFRALGLKLLSGREFFPEEYQSGRNQAVYFSEKFWQRWFGADPSLIGKTVELERETHVVAGILPTLPGEFHSPDAVVPLPVTREILQAYDRRSMVVAVRLKPGVKKEQAEEEIRAIYRRLGEEIPQSSRNKEGYLVEAARFWRGDAHEPLAALALAVGLVLLLACANLAGLLLARAAARLREIAIRSALGASQFRIFRQIITESLLLSLAGGAAGIAVAAWAIRYLRSWPRLRLPRIEQAQLDLHALLFALAVSIAAGLVFGSAPAWSVLRLRIAPALNEESRGSSGGISRSWLRRVLVGAEVAICAVLLVGSGLLWRTYQRLSSTDMGFRPEGVLVLRIMMPTAAYPTDEARSAVQSAALERLRSLPGVLQAGITAYPPLSSVNWPCQFRIPGDESGGEMQPTSYNTVSPGYFAAIGARILEGRDFSDADTPSSPRVLLISETFRRLYFPGTNPIGRRIEYELLGEKSEGVVVGVVSDLAFERPDNVRRPVIYESYTQRPWPFPVFTVKTSMPPQQAAAMMARAISEVAPEVAVDQPSELRIRVERATGQQAAALLLFGVFAAVAILLSAVGLYGVLALAVTQRRREIGVRMALGATPAEIRRMVFRYGLMLALTGVAAGLAAAPFAGMTLEKMIYGVRWFDPAVYAGVILLLTAVSLGAAAAPALRAASLDPAQALRE